jgi:rSAM/selenodomain-associated transferase 1
VAIFARASKPGKAKTRLMSLLGPRGAARFHAALVADTVRKVAALSLKVRRYFFLAGPGVPAGFPSSYTLRRQRGADLGARLEGAFGELLVPHEAAVVIGTDSPLLPRSAFRLAFIELQLSDAVLGPSPDGGFYLIGLRRQPKQAFRGVRWGTRFASHDMLRNLLRENYTCSILPSVADVDRPRDLRMLERQWARSRSTRQLAPSAWRFIASWRRRDLVDERSRANSRHARSIPRRGPRRRGRTRRLGRA